LDVAWKQAWRAQDPKTGYDEIKEERVELVDYEIQIYNKVQQLKKERNPLLEESRQLREALEELEEER
jgi:hypothetical protein